MRVQIPTTHEARLGRMGMDPAQDHQLLPIAVIEQRALVHHLARVARALLLRDHQLADEQRVRDQRPAQEPARLEVARRVGRREREEGVSQFGRQEDGAERRAVLEVGGWLEAVAWRGEVGAAGGGGGMGVWDGFVRFEGFGGERWRSGVD